MSEVSTLRLHLLRAMYLIIAVGLALMIWPRILFVPTLPGHMQSVVRAFLGALALLALVGLRYPVRMIPLLLFELTWKAIWLLAFALRFNAAGQVTPDIAESIRACLYGVILVPIALPWRHVFDRYVRAPGDRWR